MRFIRPAAVSVHCAVLSVVEQERLPVRNHCCRSRGNVCWGQSLVRPGLRQIDNVCVLVCITSGEQCVQPQSLRLTKSNTVLESGIRLLASDHVQVVFDHDRCVCASISLCQRIATGRTFLHDCQKLCTTVLGNRSAFARPTEIARPRKRGYAIFCH